MLANIQQVGLHFVRKQYMEVNVSVELVVRKMTDRLAFQ